MDFQNQFGPRNFDPVKKNSDQEISNEKKVEANISLSRGLHFKNFSSQQESDGMGRKSPKLIAFLDSMITISLVALFFGVPLFFTGLALQGILFEKQTYFFFWILLAAVCWVSKGVVTGEMRIAKTPLDVPLGIFWLSSLLSLFFSVDKLHSFWGFFGDPSRGFANITALIVAYYLIASHCNKKRFLLWTGALAAANFVLAVWLMLGTMGMLHISEKMSSYFPLSPLGSLTSTAIFLGAMLPIVATLVLSLAENNSQKKDWKKTAGIALLIFTLVANLFVLLVMYSFASWISILLGVSFFLIYIIAQIVRPLHDWTWLPMVVFVAILGILIMGNNSIARVTLPIEATPSAQLSWSVAKDSLKDHFLFGSGGATYGYDFSLHKPQDFNLNPYYGLRFSQGAGILFESLATLGALGSVALVLLLLTFLSVGVYLLSIDKKKNKLYSLGIFSASLIMLAGALLGKTDGAMLAIGSLVGALAVAILQHESESEKGFLVLSLKASAKYALALAFVFMLVSAGVVFAFVFIGKIYVADLRAGSAMRESEITQDGSVKKLAQAISLNGNESRYYVLLGNELMSLANKEALKDEKDRNIGLIQNYLNSAIAGVAQAENLSPKDVATVEALAGVYENSGLYVADSFTLAQNNYQRALELEPHNPLYFVKIGQIKMTQAAASRTADSAKSLVGEARDWFQKALDQKNNYALAYYQLALADEALGNTDDAIGAIDKAVTLEQTNVNYLYNTARLHQSRGNDNDNKIAEMIYQSILSKDSKEVNSLFGLGLLYEKTKRPNDAAAEYKKVLDALPKDNVDVRTKIQKMISNIAAGIENKPETLGSGAPQTNADAATVPTPPIDNAAPGATPAQ